MSCIKPMKMRIEAILRLRPPTMSKGFRSFSRIVNFLRLFCPEVQNMLKLIYDLMRKGKIFYWDDKQQEAFGEIEKWLPKTPVLYWLFEIFWWQ